MKFSINQTELQTALATVGRGISSRSTLPILSGIHLIGKDDSLQLQTTNLELSIKYKTPALIEEEGSVVVPGRLFTDIIKNLPDAAVEISTENEIAHISCGSASFTIKTLPAGDFPAFPEVETTQQISLPFSLFTTMVKKVAKCVSKDESRAILTGVFIQTGDEILSMVATDSYRLSIAKTPFENSNLEDFAAVISGSFLLDLAGLQKTEEPITLALSDNQIVVTYNDTVFINRRIEGNFPNYRQLLPEGYTTRVEVSTSEILDAVRRSSLISASSPHIKCSFDPSNKLITIHSSSQDVGSSEETLYCDGDGEPIEIAFNSHYLIDGLASIDDDTLFVELQNPTKPGIVKNQDGTYLYLVMPVRL